MQVLYRLGRLEARLNGHGEVLALAQSHRKRDDGVLVGPRSRSPSARGACQSLHHVHLEWAGGAGLRARESAGCCETQLRLVGVVLLASCELRHISSCLICRRCC